MQHDRARIIGRTGANLQLLDDSTALRFVAPMGDSPEESGALSQVERGILRGASIEFRSLRERIVDGVRRIQKALLVAVSVVDKGAYPGSLVEARAEVRQGEAGEVIIEYPLGEDTIESVAAARALYVEEDALDESLLAIAAGAAALTLTLGSSYDRTVASSTNGDLSAEKASIPARPATTTEPAQPARQVVRVTARRVLPTAAATELRSVLQRGVRMASSLGIVDQEVLQESLSALEVNKIARGDKRKWTRRRVVKGGLCESRIRFSGGGGTVRSGRRRGRRYAYPLP